MEIEMNSGMEITDAKAPQTVETPASAPETTESSSDDDSHQQNPAPEAPKAEPAKPELTLKEKFAKKAEELAAKTPKTDENEPEKAPLPGEKKDLKTAPKPGFSGEKTPAQINSDYKANLKYRFTDATGEKKEAEFPDWAKAVIKDEKSENELRSLFAKANGIEFMESRFTKARDRAANYDNILTNLKTKYAANDLGGVFDILGVPEEKVLQYALQRAQYYELPQEQRAMIDQKRSAEQQAEMYRTQVQQYEAQQAEYAVQSKTQALQMAFSQADVSQAAKQFDERIGKSGAFAEAVRQHGETTWYRTQGRVDLTPEQAVKEVMANYGLTGAQMQQTQQSGAQAAPAQQNVQASNSVVAPAQVKVIPNLAGKGTSPASGTSKPRSIDDLKKLAKGINAQG